MIYKKLVFQLQNYLSQQLSLCERKKTDFVSLRYWDGWRQKLAGAKQLNVGQHYYGRQQNDAGYVFKIPKKEKKVL